MKLLYVVRHGQTEWNLEGRLQGRLNSDLTATGRAHADANGQLLSDFGVDKLLASPLGRTRATAHIINGYLDLPLDLDERLVERDCGDWSGLTLEQARERNPRIWDSRDEDPFHYRPPGGENLVDMLSRVAPLLNELSQSQHERVVLISHGVMARAILTHFFDLPPAQANAVKQPNNLMYRVSFDAGAPQSGYYRGGPDLFPGFYTG